VMTLGELRAGVAQGHRTVLLVKIGTGIGAGIVIDGRLHRGAQGSAGDVGHIQVTHDPSVVCRCGKVGCLEALAGGAALARAATALAQSGESVLLAERLKEKGSLEAADVAWAAGRGDARSANLITDAGHLIGEMLSTAVHFLNPSLVVIGGGVANVGDQLLAAIRETVYGHSLPLATRELQVRRSGLGSRSGVVGVSTMVIDELFSLERFREWVEVGAPIGMHGLAATGG